MRKGPAGSLSRSLHFGHSALYSEIDRRATEVEPRVIAWRRDIHEHPELSFQCESSMFSSCRRPVARAGEPEHRLVSPARAASALPHMLRSL